ncbi:MAG TPA: NAD(P)-dependent oxidoreductase [Solirubrobacteraceae bacterium]|nr:NAD(P)-dependent oxidoreductase [Solirubrobacteraceae bacterium]
MSRVLITGGAGPLGAAVARRLLADPAFDVRVSDERPAPQWMREGCEMHRGDLRVPAQASAATKRCSHVVHLACFEQRIPHLVPNGAGGERDGESSANGSSARTPESNGATGSAIARAGGSPNTLLEYEGALHGAVTRAAIERGTERFLYVSSPLVFERAELFPTPEEHLEECLAPRSAAGFARLSGERLCAAAHQEHGLQYVICRPFGSYGPTLVSAASSGEEQAEGEPALAGPAAGLSELIERAGAGKKPLSIVGSGEQTLTPTHVDDLAEGIVAALSSPAAVNDDFNLAAARELSLAEIAQIAWKAGTGAGPVAKRATGTRSTGGPTLKPLPAREIDLQRSCPSVAKARELLGWEARIDAAEGIAALAAGAGERAARRVAAASAGN